jgi:HrpA-like RNA helicase
MTTEESSRNIFLPRDRLFEERGVLDPDGKNDNPLTKTKYVNLYEDDTNVGSYIDQAAKWGSTPVYERREEILNAIYDNQVILLISGTGSGKTVMMPKFVLHVLNYEGVIAITNPKRLPAEENAKRSAQNLDVELGSAVGIKYRDSKREWMSDETKLIYCTDGILLAQMKSDPLLMDYDCVIIDEAHERALNIDLLLMLLKDVVRKRPEFKVVIMSATINEQIFVDYYTKDPKDKDIKFIKVDGGQKENKPIEEFFVEDFQFDLATSPSLPFIQINDIDNTVHSKVRYGIGDSYANTRRRATW